MLAGRGSLAHRVGVAAAAVALSAVGTAGASGVGGAGGAGSANSITGTLSHLRRRWRGWRAVRRRQQAQAVRVAAVLAATRPTGTAGTANTGGGGGGSMGNTAGGNGGLRLHSDCVLRRGIWRTSAKIENGVVTQAIAVRNEDILDDVGVTSETVGQAYLAVNGFDGEWVQTSYNGTVRGKYAGMGDKLDGSQFARDEPVAEVALGRRSARQRHSVDGQRVHGISRQRVSAVAEAVPEETGV